MTPDGEKKLFDRLELMSNQLATIEDLLRRHWVGGQLATPPGAQIPDINDRSEHAPLPRAQGPGGMKSSDAKNPEVQVTDWRSNDE